ncbi:MAG: TraR/DksA C4-type zinc finger protein [Patescibacteria group bacterium]
MTKDKLKYFEMKLTAEKKLLEDELKTVGRRNPHNPNDWEPKYTNTNTDSADQLEVAEELENYQNNIAILNNLESKYNEVLKAIEKIHQNKYGTCEVCKETIEEDRLEANPSARTCKKHMN